MEESEPLNLDSPKRHSDPAPCTSQCSHCSPASAFTFSVPDLRNYQSSKGSSSTSPAKSPLPEGSARACTPSPSRQSLSSRPRLQKQRRYSQGTPTYTRRATHPHVSPGRFRRSSLLLDEDPWSQYRTRVGSFSVPNGDDKPFMAEESGCYRLRSFSVTSKGVVNLGDFVRTRSPSVTSDESSSGVEQDFRERLPSVESTIFVPLLPTRYRALLLGAEGVGKTSLIAQFTTSECLTTVASDNQESLDGSQERTVCLLVDGEETELSCEDPNDSTYEVDEATFQSTDAFLLVYSVTNRKSLSVALQTLEKLRWLETKCQYLYPNVTPKVFILVANKIDLVRTRIITTDEGRTLADKLDIKYIETSVGFNHNVDELLVGIVTQIRLKRAQPQVAQTTMKRFIARSVKLTFKARGFVDRLLQKCDLKTKSCDNLNVL